MPSRNPYESFSLEPPDPRVVPIFGCKPFGRNTVCDDVHHGPLPSYSKLVCMAGKKCCTGSQVTRFLNWKRRLGKKREKAARVIERRDAWREALQAKREKSRRKHKVA